MVVLTNGCFVELTEWHKKYLQDAAKLGDVVVLINSNKSVEEIKGYNKLPSEEERISALKALPYIKEVVVFEGNPIPYFYKFKPDVYVKGGDYGILTINQNERRTLEELGTKIVFTKKYDKPEAYYYDKGYFDIEKFQNELNK